MERSDMRTVKNLEPCVVRDVCTPRKDTVSEKCALRHGVCVHIRQLLSCSPCRGSSASSLGVLLAKAFASLAIRSVDLHGIGRHQSSNLEGCATRRTPLRLAAHVTNRAALSCGKCPKKIILRRESVLHVQFCTDGTSVNVTTDHDC